MAAITSENAALGIVKLLAAEVLPALQNNLVIGALVNQNFSASLASAGDTVNVPIRPQLSANNIAEGGSVTTQNPSMGNAVITLSTHAEASFTIPDVTAALNQVNLMGEYGQSAMEAIAQKIEGELFGLYPLLTANTAVGTGNTALTEAVIDSAETTLFNAKVPEAAPKYLLVSGTAYGQLRQLSRFSETQTIGSGTPIVNGMVGTLKGFNVIRSQNVKKPSTTTYNLAITRDTLALVTRRLPQPMSGTGAVASYAEMGNFGMRVIMSYNPNTLSQQFTVDVLFGVGVLREQFGLQVLS